MSCLVESRVGTERRGGSRSCLVESQIGTERRGGREFPWFLDVGGLTSESGAVRPAPLRPV